MSRRLVSTIAIGLLSIASVAVAQPPDTAAVEEEPRRLTIDATPWKGDFGGMLERRHIRVLVPYSRTLFFVDKGHERGLSAELVRDFEGYLNRKYAKTLKRRPITISLIPTTRDRLLTSLAQGLGDIAVGNLTVTTERIKIADFVTFTGMPPVREVLVTGPGSPQVATVDGLSDQRVDVRLSSSFYESLIALNARLGRAGKPAARIVLLPDALEDEDILEMLNAGIIDLAVVDSWKARIWARVLPNIKVREDVVLRNEGASGWAIRPQSPGLRAEIEDFHRRYVNEEAAVEARLARLEKRIKRISNSTKGAELRRFDQTVTLFRKYGDKYDFDPLMLVAQGFQESKLDQSARSHMGAVGVMQLMPATGAELKVGDIHKLEPNIHAGAKYMDQLMTRYFPDARFSPVDRPLFAFASYNAGPGNISRMRKAAAQRGLDPDRWFNNVELVVAEKIGIETTTYVRNIYKYYVAYKLILAAEEARRQARKKVHASTR
jgi:membrane-bound lytic murein transglycosylase MltF